MKIIALALRALTRFRLYSVINILGLALSLTCVIIISRFVYGEITVDHLHSRLDRLYITTMEVSNRPGNLLLTGVSNPNNEENFYDLCTHPAVELSADFLRFDDATVTVDNQLFNCNMLVAEAPFLQMTDFPLLAGVGELKRPEDALIRESFARKVFGEANPIGKTIRYESVMQDLTIVGVLADDDTKSSITFDMVANYTVSDDWGKMNQTMVLLYPHTDWREVNRQADRFNEMTKWDYGVKYQLYPMSEVYFQQQMNDYFGYGNSNPTYVWILTLVGMLILLIGVVNFINIYLVVLLRRGRELGMKKVFGAEGGWIFLQLFVENLMMISIAVICGLGLAELLNPFVKNVLGFDQFPYRLFDLLLLGSMLLLLPLLTTLVPYLQYKRQAPIQSIKQLSKSGKVKRSGRLFLVVQYIITFVMIMVSVYFLTHLRYLLHVDVGIHADNVIQVPFLKQHASFRIFNEEEWRARNNKELELLQALRQKLEESPLILGWSMNDSPFGESNKNTFNFSLPGGEEHPTQLLGVDEKWLKLFDVELLDGRLWDDEVDNMYMYNLIVSESLLQQFGITDWREAELQPYRRIWFAVGMGEDMSKNPPYRIVGVIKDLKLTHLSNRQHPVAVYHASGIRYSPVMASFAPENRQAVIAFMQELHEELVGGEFTYSFVEEDRAAMYANDRRVATIYALFTLIAIVISSLGLFSMSLYDVQQQRRDIALRKVNGAVTREIVLHLLKRYVVLLAIAFVISLPVAVLAIHHYSSDFANHAPLSWWIFVVSLVITSGVSLLTLVWQTRKAASANPIHSIKSE